MLSQGPGAVLLGRRSERDALDKLLETVRDGRSKALVVLGEAGIGKTALLEHAIGSATGFRVARAAGIQSEMELPFAGLHQLCAPMLDRLERLPDPQRDALGVAFGLTTGDAPDRFFVGLAVLGLLSKVSRDQPLVCVVDDAHWLDRASAQALAFVARRLLAESVALVLAAREPSRDLTGLPALVVSGLRDADARMLLDSALPTPLDERVRERFVAEARGNPLALPAQTRRLLLVAAAEPTGGPGGALASRRTDRDRRLRGRCRRVPGIAGDRRRGDVSPSAGALGGLPVGVAERPPGGARRAGGGRRVAGWQPQRHSWSEPRRSRQTPASGRSAHWPRRRPSTRPARSTRPCRSSPRQRPDRWKRISVRASTCSAPGSCSPRIAATTPPRSCSRPRGDSSRWTSRRRVTSIWVP